MFWVILILIVVVPIILVARGVGRANGWIYDTFTEFYREALRGRTRYPRTLTRVLAMLSSVVVVVIIIALIMMLT